MVAPALSAAVSVEEETRRQTLLAQVVAYYHQTLLNEPEALTYLEKRRLNHPELVSLFKLGYANRTLGYRLPEKKIKAGAEVRAQLQAVGVLRSNGHEHLRGSLVVPVISPDGVVGKLYGRKIGDVRASKTALHLYLPDAHRGVWNEAALMVSKSIILCESLIDALSFWAVGQRHVTV